MKNAIRNAVADLNAKGLMGAAAAYRVLSETPMTQEIARFREEAMKGLYQKGRAMYVVAGIQSFIRRAGLRGNVTSTVFGGIRCMCAVPAKGTHYLIALDTGVDVNCGTVVTQWVTRKPVSAQNIPILLADSSKIMRDSELSGEYFEKYSEINAVTGNMRRTVDGMEKAVKQRFMEKLRKLQE